MTRDRPATVDELRFEPALEGSTGTVFSCPLCGGRYTHGEKACRTCPLSAGCDVIQCPHCGYQYPRSSWLVTWFTRRFRRGEARDDT